ncbi:hypothetical protein MNV49_003058 [Pseudohyphozyma bogoriensis]|nr:hypothetical protein MNV49_003058 [Pseudohyphozyma bogoriensis]
MGGFSYKPMIKPISTAARTAQHAPSSSTAQHPAPHQRHHSQHQTFPQPDSSPTHPTQFPSTKFNPNWNGPSRETTAASSRPTPPSNSRLQSSSHSRLAPSWQPETSARPSDSDHRSPTNSGAQSVRSPPLVASPVEAETARPTATPSSSAQPEAMHQQRNDKPPPVVVNDSLSPLSSLSPSQASTTPLPAPPSTATNSRDCTPWQEDEDARWEKAVTRLAEKKTKIDWDLVAISVGTRESGECEARWTEKGKARGIVAREDRRREVGGRAGDAIPEAEDSEEVEDDEDEEDGDFDNEEEEEESDGADRPLFSRPAMAKAGCVWTPQEKSILISMCEESTNRRRDPDLPLITWEAISKKLNGIRTPQACKQEHRKLVKRGLCPQVSLCLHDEDETEEVVPVAERSRSKLSSTAQTTTSPSTLQRSAPPASPASGPSSHSTFRSAITSETNRKGFEDGGSRSNASKTPSSFRHSGASPTSSSSARGASHLEERRSRYSSKASTTSDEVGTRAPPSIASESSRYKEQRVTTHGQQSSHGTHVSPPAHASQRQTHPAPKRSRVEDDNSPASKKGKRAGVIHQSTQPPPAPHHQQQPSRSQAQRGPSATQSTSSSALPPSSSLSTFLDSLINKYDTLSLRRAEAVRADDDDAKKLAEERLKLVEKMIELERNSVHLL